MCTSFHFSSVRIASPRLTPPNPVPLEADTLWRFLIVQVLRWQQTEGYHQRLIRLVGLVVLPIDIETSSKLATLKQRHRE